SPNRSVIDPSALFGRSADGRPNRIRAPVGRLQRLSDERIRDRTITVQPKACDLRSGGRTENIPSRLSRTEHRKVRLSVAVIVARYRQIAGGPECSSVIGHILAPD